MEAFIRGSFAGLGDNRGPSGSGGTFKTSMRFRVDPSSGTVRGFENQIGSTRGTPGIGGNSVTSRGGGDFTVSGSAVNGSGKGPLIDYSFDLSVSESGGVSLTGGKHDGFPSYEIWVYGEGKDPQRLYYKDQGNPINALRLFGTGDTKVKPNQ